MNKKGTNNNTFITYILVLFVIVCEIFRQKYFFIESNNILEVSLTNIVYPFTYLFTIIILNKTSFKDTHRTIIKTTLFLLIFILLVTTLNNIPGNYHSRENDLYLIKIFTPNTINIGKNIIYSPNILSLISYILLFYFSHTLIIILYEAMKPYTKKYIAFALAMFIPYALDTIGYIVINDTFNNIEFYDLINHLTANFVLVIITTIISTIIYSLKKVSSKS